APLPARLRGWALHQPRAADRRDEGDVLRSSRIVDRRMARGAPCHPPIASLLRRNPPRRVRTLRAANGRCRQRLRREDARDQYVHPVVGKRGVLDRRRPPRSTGCRGRIDPKGSPRPSRRGCGAIARSRPIRALAPPPHRLLDRGYFTSVGMLTFPAAICFCFASTVATMSFGTFG